MTTWVVEARAEGVRVASPRGTYLVVADVLRGELRTANGAAVLPSEAELMRRHGVSRTTVRRALRTLAEEGVVASVPGKGWTFLGGDASGVRPLVEQVRELIRVDGLEPGDRFPSESMLSDRFGVSRGSVRQALAQLQGEGILKVVHGRGRFVQALPEPSESEGP
ncbi:GntR family transcriptional regulator [Streptomyces albidus (ex Kaewkla and Franco 2022)]|uniref:GntR family transcriptional regulator n=1 Tax=Streptomyces albidus (ex Kaewkla and Franco 2022) TaxID=722709 RepID=UPI001B3561CF|nr:GntR family transcriptional regulator [Streptomyces albidus (ex Kaewkla and Franco 2022)]